MKDLRSGIRDLEGWFDQTGESCVGGDVQVERFNVCVTAERLKNW